MLRNFLFRGFPHLLFVYANFAPIHRIFGNVLTQQWLVYWINIGHRTVQPWPRPAYSESIYFQFHFPYIHEWLWFKLLWHSILTQPSHRKIVQIDSKMGHFGQIIEPRISCYTYKMCHFLNAVEIPVWFVFCFFMWCLVSFPESKTSKQTNKTSGKSVHFFVIVLSNGCSVALTAVQILFCSVGCTTWTAQQASQSTTTASQDIFSNSTVGFFLQVTSVCSSSLVTYSNSWANHSFPKYHWGGSLMWLSLPPACRLVLH